METLNIKNLLGENTIEKTLMPDPKIMKAKLAIRTKRIHLKAKKKNEIRLEHLRELLSELPKVNESFHVVSSGNFDFWMYIPYLIGMMGYADNLYVSTWTMSREVVNQIFEMFDTGKAKSLSVMTGLYLKRRETAVYTMLLNGIINRNQRYVAFKNHTKLLLLSNIKSNVYLVIEGSANLTANPRAEQFILTHSRELYNFHCEWMNDMFERAK